MNFRKTVLYATLLCLASSAFAQNNRGTADLTIKAAKITINYGRPSLGGRDSRLGEASDGMVWRLGMNQATEIETTHDLIVAGKVVKAGKYTLWAKKVSGNNWLLAFNPKTGVWGEPALTEGFIAELPLKLEKAAEPVDPLTISLAEGKGKAWIKVQWGKDVLTGSFDVK